MNVDRKSIPVRNCCGKRHLGAVCPDGFVMCCLCFERVSLDQLNRVKGALENVCKKCAERESEVAGVGHPWSDLSDVANHTDPT